MNILMMTNTYAPIVGGLEKSVQAFSQTFRRAGHKVLVVAPDFPGAPEREAHVLRLPSLQRFNGTDFSVNLPIPGLLSKLVDTFRPDVVHAHHPFLMGDMALRLCGQYHLPLVYTHHVLFEQYAHYLPLNQDTARRFLVELSSGYANLADHVIAPSRGVRAQLRREEVETPIAVVPTGVDLRPYRHADGCRFRREWNIPARAFLLGYAGRIAVEKNLEFLAEAVSRYLRRDRNARMLMVGQGPLSKNLRSLFKKTGVQNRVIWTGLLGGRRLADAYRAMDVFVFSSLSETQGMVVTEAMAAGTPVAALDGPGVREVVRDRINGRLLGSRDEARFVEALEWMRTAEPPLRRRMREEARRTAESLSLDRCAARALLVYRRAAEGKKKTGRDLASSAWSRGMLRIKTEWDMLGNFGKAAVQALTENILPSRRAA